MSTPEPCDLCGLDIGSAHFVLNGPDRAYHFCCEGCRGIYEMLHDIKETPLVLEDNPAKLIGKDTK